MDKYDIIIIGSGLGGLECGAMLTKEGFNVCVLEKNEQFGGCFQTYKRRGYLLDTGIHYIGSMDEGQVLNQYFRYFGIRDKISLCRLDAGSFDEIYYKGKSYPFAMGHELFVETLSRYFPRQRQNLRQYVSMVREVGNLISVDNLRKGILANNGMKYIGMPASGVISGLITEPDLQQILAGSSLLYGGIKDRSTFYHHGMINNSFIESAYRFTDGSMKVSLELINVIRAGGGTVINNSEVTRILVKNEKVTGVEVNHETVIECKGLISDIHPKRTYEITDKCRRIRKATISRFESLDNSYGIFTAYFLMKDKTCPYINRNIHIHDIEDVWYDKKQMGKTESCMVSMQYADPEKKYAGVISVLTPMYMEELLQWENTTPENRGEDYKEFKNKKVKQLYRLLEKNSIFTKEQVDAVYTTTPLSYRDYTATVDGSAYGIIKDYRRPQTGFLSTRTKLENLLLTGQNLNVHGALGVTLTAAITCAGLIGTEYLAKKIGNA